MLGVWRCVLFADQLSVATWESSCTALILHDESRHARVYGMAMLSRC